MERLNDFRAFVEYLLSESKMKHLLKFLGMAIPVILVMNSCSPTVTGEAPTTLDLNSKTRNQTNAFGGILNSTADTNTYVYKLSCGCPFELKFEGTDTTSIRYDLGTSGTSYTSHIIRAFPRAGLAKGTHTGWAAIVTLQPDTNPDLRDTMRDTVIVP